MHTSSRAPIGRLVQLLFAFLLLSAAVPAMAQAINATSYPFAASSDVPLEDMSSGTTQLVGASSDDGNSTLQNIGFDFWFAGTRATQFSANANGIVRLGSAVITGDNFSNSLASTTTTPKIAPYWDDLCTGNNGRVHYKLVGAAPNRKLVVEWQNMQITRGGGCSGAGNGTFQLWLFENTGEIQSVYGALPVAAADGGYSVGLQAGAATNIASVTTGAGTVSYATANNTQTNAIAAGTSFTFSPPTPDAPTGLNFTGVTPTSITVNWTDNSSNEVAFGVFYSDNGGASFTFAGQAAANGVSLPVTGLTPDTNYQFRVIAVTGGAQSTALSGSQSTLPPGNIASAASGLWSDPATWQGGIVPTSADNVTISAGQTVTVDVAASALTLAVSSGATLVYDAAAARTLTVVTDLTINAGGTITTPATGTVTTHLLSLSGNLTNNGTLDFSTNGDTAGAGITFTGGATSTFAINGGTDIRTITVNKGSSFAPIVELVGSGAFTVRGAATDVAGWLTLTNGTLKLSGTFAGTNRVFPTATYSIPATGGFWLDNPNYTVAGQAGGTTTANNGLLRISAGTYNIGVGAGDGMTGAGGSSGTYIIEGGTLNSTGRIDPQGPVTWNQSGGTVNVGTVGNSRSNFGTFELFSTASAFTMSGGTINVVQPSTGATKVDFNIRSATFSITGGEVVIGAAPAPAGSTYVDNGGFIPSFTVNTGMTLNINNAAVFFRGTTITNNGAITSTGTGARFDFAGSAPMTYGGSGVFGTAATPFGGVGISANSPSPTTLNAPLVVNRVNLFTGGFVNSDQITLGNGGTSTTVVQIGSAGLTTSGGNFDVSPNHNQGSGGQIVIYASEATPRTTGVEINPTRVLTSLSVDQPNGVTLSGGDLTLASTAAAATFTNGRVITGSNVLSLSSPTATITRTNGYVDGNLRKAFAAAGSKTFEVGTANGFSPVAVNVTDATFPVDATARAIEGPLAAISPAGGALQRHWSVDAPAGTTANLTFTYLDPADIPGTATEADFVVYRRDGGTLTDLGGTVNTTANTGAVTDVTTFGEFTLAEPGAILGSAPSIAAVPVSRRAGDAGSSAIVANVSDGEDAAPTLAVTVDGGASATTNGVTVGAISTNVSGQVTANVIAACGATDAAFTLRVTDSSDLFAESTLNVTVLPNLPPQLAYPASSSVASGESLNVNPTSGPTDSGSITSIVVQSNGTYTGGSSVNGAGVVALTSAAPVGSHTLVIRATDNCSATTDANLVVDVGGTPPFPATVNVGVGEVYTSLTNAGGLFEAINASVLASDVTANVTSDLAETGAIALNPIAEVGVGGYRLTIRPSAAVERVIAGASAAGLVRLNGADRVVFDGRFDGAGRFFRFRNTASGATFLLSNDATFNEIRSSFVESANTSGTSGTIFFGAGAGAGGVGNSFNTIADCDVRDRSDAAGVPANAVFSLGVAGSPNAGNTVSNNNIFNFTAQGVLVAATGAGDGWSITGNSVFQTASRTTLLIGIALLGGNGHVIGGNSVGGGQPGAGGPFLATNNRFRGIDVVAGAGAPVTIQNNTVKNIRGTSTSFTASYGIFVESGNANVTGNVVGSSDPNERYEINGDSVGVRVTSANTVTVANNRVQNFVTAANVPTGEFWFGILVEGAGSHTVEDNTVADLRNGSRPDSSFDTQTIALLVQATGVQTVRGNIVRDSGSSATAASTARNNRVWGIILSGTASGTIAENNRVTNLFASSSSTGARVDVLTLFQLQGLANASVVNNMLSTDGGTGSTDRAIFGVLDLNAAGATASYLHNSVNLTGVASGANNSYAFNRNGAGGVVSLRNNVFQNLRSGGTGFHVAMAQTNASATGWSASASDFNVLNNATPSHLTQWLGSAGANNLDLAGFAAASGGDANSQNANPEFVAPADLHIALTSPARNAGTPTAVATDIDGDARSTAIPDIGADEINAVPSISAVGVTRTAGDPGANATIANVSDADDAESALVVTVNGGATATVNDVTVSNVATGATGVVTADVVAGCTATSASFTVRVTDTNSAFAQATLNVTVLANPAPVLSYAATNAFFGQSLNVVPATGPSDNSGVTSIVVQSVGTYAGGASVDNAGVVALTGAQPVGAHSIVVRASDACGAFTDATLPLTVAKANTVVTILTDSPDPSSVGETVTVTYTVAAAAPGAGTPTGNVTVSDGTDSCTATVAAGQCTVALTTSGNRTLTATYAGDANFNSGSDTEPHVVGAATDLAITKTSNLSQVATGLVQYTVVATNLGPVAVTGATVADTLPAIISGATWTCSGTGGGTCTGSGSGNINQSVNLPVGASVTFAISGTVPTDPLPGFFSNTATVTSPAGVPDTNLANNTATVTDAVTLFSDGFEDATVAAQIVAPGIGGSLLLDTGDVLRGAVDASPRDVGLFVLGDQLALVSARRVGGEVQVRVLQRDAAGNWHAGPWAAVLPQQSLSLLWSNDGAGMLRTGIRVD